MEELDIQIVLRRSIRGIFALVSRTFIIQIIAFLANFFLTIYLSPEVFGVYFIVTAFIAFITYFSDIGLAAALIQKKERISEKDLATTFTIQQILVITLVVTVLFLASPIGHFYNLDQNGIYLFQAFAIAFFLSSLKTIPSVLLERNLRFEKLVIPQIIETLVFYCVALYLAVQGYGVVSFTIAVLARGFCGLIAIYIIAPWKISVGYSKESARHLLKFGIPFQTNSVLALIKDDLITFYLGKILPLGQVGYIGFAQKWAFTPLRLVMDNIIRITFPSFSRIQHEKDALRVAIEKTLFGISLFVFPSIMGLILLGQYFVNLIPKYQKWEPALLSLTFFGINAMLSSVSTPLTNALNAIGKIHVSLRLMIGWTIATWVITPLFISFFGFNGFAFANAIIACSVFIVVIITKRYIQFSLVRSIRNPSLATFVMSIGIITLGPFVVTNLLALFVMVAVSMVLYFATMYILAREEFKTDIALIISQLKK